MKPSQSARSAGYAASLEPVAAPVVRAALLQDIGRGGDLTTDAIVESERLAHARIIARRGGILAGLDFAAMSQEQRDTRRIARCHSDKGECARVSPIRRSTLGGAATPPDCWQIDTRQFCSPSDSAIRWWEPDADY